MPQESLSLPEGHYPAILVEFSVSFQNCIVEGNEMSLDQIPDNKYIAHPCQWEMFLRRIVDILHAVQDDDEYIKAELRQVWSLIFNCLYLHCLLPPGGAAEYKRCLISQAILAFGNVLHLKEVFVGCILLWTKMEINTRPLGS